jgi:hypothetical protein
MEDARATLMSVSEGSTKSVALDLYVR